MLDLPMRMCGPEEWCDPKRLTKEMIEKLEELKREIEEEDKENEEAKKNKWT